MSGRDCSGACKLLLCGGTEVRGGALRLASAAETLRDEVMLREIRGNRITSHESESIIEQLESIGEALDKFYTLLERASKEIGSGT